MKKLLLSSFVFLFAASMVQARSNSVSAPVDQSGSPVQNATYAGVDFATATVIFSTCSKVIFTGPGALVGFVVSSAALADAQPFVLFRATGSVLHPLVGDTLINDEICRIYISSNGSNASNIYQQGLSYRFPEPVFSPDGMTGRVVGSMVNSIMYLYNKY